MASFLLVILVMGGTLYFSLAPILGNFLIAETSAGLVAEAKLARLTVKREIVDMRRDAPAQAAAIARESRARVTIISAQGEVLGDSEVKPGDLKELENHGDRPEVQQALHTGQGSSIRYSATLRIPMLYVAFPFQASDG